jgi:hypothetical protein
LDLKEGEQKHYTIVHDGEAPIILAWRATFSKMPHEVCSNHFRLNIEEQLRYKLHVHDGKGVNDPKPFTEMKRTITGYLNKAGIIDFYNDDLKIEYSKFEARWYVNNLTCTNLY